MHRRVWSGAARDCGLFLVVLILLLLPGFVGIGLGYFWDWLDRTKLRRRT